MANISIGAAWDEAKAMLERDQKRIVPVALTLLLLPAALMVMLTGADSGGGANALPPQMTLLVFVLMIVTLIGNLAIARLGLGAAESVGDALKHAAVRVWAMLGALLLVALPFALALSVVFVATGVNPEAPAAASMSGGASILILLLAVAFFYVIIRATLANVVAVAEPGGPIKVLKRAFELSKGQFLRLFLFVVLLVGLALIVSLAVGSVAGTLVAFGTGKVEPLSVSALLLGLVQGAISTGLSVTYVLMLASMYRQRAAG